MVCYPSIQYGVSFVTAELKSYSNYSVEKEIQPLELSFKSLRQTPKVTQIYSLKKRQEQFSAEQKAKNYK